MKIHNYTAPGKPEGLNDLRNKERLAAFEEENEKLRKYRRELLAMHAKAIHERDKASNSHEDEFCMDSFAPIALVSLTIFAVLFAVLYFTS